MVRHWIATPVMQVQVLLLAMQREANRKRRIASLSTILFLREDVAEHQEAGH